MYKNIQIVIWASLFLAYSLTYGEIEGAFLVSHAEVYINRSELLGKTIRVQGVLVLGESFDAHHLGSLYPNTDDFQKKRFKNALYLELKDTSVRPKQHLKKGVEAIITGVVGEVAGPVPGMKRPLVIVADIHIVEEETDSNQIR